MSAPLYCALCLVDDDADPSHGDTMIDGTAMCYRHAKEASDDR